MTLHLLRLRTNFLRAANQNNEIALLLLLDLVVATKRNPARSFAKALSTKRSSGRSAASHRILLYKLFVLLRAVALCDELEPLLLLVWPVVATIAGPPQRSLPLVLVVDLPRVRQRKSLAK